ncbi:MAG TPA: hypothetical protein VGS22_02125 [Thermoanaerobaculia bacterium]|jgi:hypothetical protein|nr:hypothetical protein [Thermoanaerobaculia bacterium]
MKIAEIKEHQGRYRKSVEAYAELQGCLEAVGRAVDRLPGLRLEREKLKKATKALHDMGTTVALVGEFAAELVAEKVIRAKMRRQGAAAGIVFRYDPENELEDVGLPETAAVNDDDLE